MHVLLAGTLDSFFSFRLDGGSVFWWIGLPF
jgi:hypothetical protein